MPSWNPWHGCKKVSEGCQNCYMFYIDAQHDRYGGNIYKVKHNFKLPLQKDRSGNYKIPSGKFVRVCLTSDFFLEEADSWRDEAWDMMRIRSDLIFMLLTKRPQRVQGCLPHDWNNGWENVHLSVTAENQHCADERIPILLELPFKQKGIMAAPLLSEIHIEKYLDTGRISYVSAGGENYTGARPCNFDWVKSLHYQCVNANVPFDFHSTGAKFIKDGKLYKIPSKLRHEQAEKSGLSFYPK